MQVYVFHDMTCIYCTITDILTLGRSDIIRPAPIMLKNLPIILSGISQMFYLLFLFYLELFPLHCQLFLFITSVVTKCHTKL